MTSANSSFTPLPAAAIEAGMRAALEEAQRFEGATAPNPPVGAAALDSLGEILAVRAHERAGTPHAEAHVLDELARRGQHSRLHTLVVTLEPCNHHGRTPPCAEAILRAGAREVIYGASDPNPRVAGRGADRMREGGIPSREIESAELKRACQELIAPFAQWALTGMPWVAVKSAHRAVDGPGARMTSTNRSGSIASPDQATTMIPPPGQKTFTSPSSLKLAHELRRRSDAILTGSGTVLADRPEFTVRHVADHPGKTRHLVVLDRRRRTPGDWIQLAETKGFSVHIADDFEVALRELGRQGVLRLLVEAGPALTQFILSTSLWNEHVVITQDLENGDRVEILRRT